MLYRSISVRLDIQKSNGERLCYFSSRINKEYGLFFTLSRDQEPDSFIFKKPKF